MLTIIKSIISDIILKFINSWRKDKQLKDLGAAEVTIGAVEKVNEAKQKVNSKSKPDNINDVLDKL
jgi:hypothetical protein